ncbi:TetR/AcrR family transcriptional regulator [Pedobacter yulinensis]|uniref:TetR/AcrR family transcriptional regulator n=1 Tax=Pedobacter yulinensis TaxID=2126353 RepID=A0A2T3HMU2_9SPHI|nr:TetR/AcrR family transcriptional regulator [Pedobacter yulinensis]PST83691.1 TetR/AcrR family transcriptional regulator [Pedobacter yulinensis]
MKKTSVNERILQTASRLFYQQGYNSTGINQIVAEAEIAIGSLYKHYRSKEELLIRYLELEETAFFKGLAEYLEAVQSPGEKLMKLIDYRIALQQRSGFAGCPFIKINAEGGRLNKQVAELVTRHKQQQKTTIKNILLERTGKKRDADLAAAAIFLLIEGAVVSSSMNGNTDDLQAVKKIVPTLV